MNAAAEDHHLLFVTGLLALIIAMAIVFFPPRFAGGAGAPVAYTILDEGRQSGIAGPVNYLITDQAGFKNLWQMLHGASSTPPAVDFSKEEVIAVFLGAGGIRIESVHDSATERRVSIEAGDCVGVAGPYGYEIAELPASPLPLTHQYVPRGSDCGVQ